MSSTAAMGALSAHRDWQAFARSSSGELWQEQAVVFGDELGGPFAPSHQPATFTRAAATANLPATRFHDMRHTAATILLAKDVHVRLVSD